MDRRSTNLREQGSWLLLLLIVLVMRPAAAASKALSARTSSGCIWQSVPMNERANRNASTQRPP
jgi:hypothetical protein